METVDERKIKIIDHLDDALLELGIDFHHRANGVELIPDIINVLQAYYDAFHRLTEEERKISLSGDDD